MHFVKQYRHHQKQYIRNERDLVVFEPLCSFMQLHVNHITRVCSGQPNSGSGRSTNINLWRWWTFNAVLCLYLFSLQALMTTAQCLRLWISAGSCCVFSPKRCWSESRRTHWPSFTRESPLHVMALPNPEGRRSCDLFTSICVLPLWVQRTVML